METPTRAAHGEVRTFTLWGEIAYHLGGVKGYELVRPSDEQRVAPGTQVWEKLIGAEPALIMIDEIAQHLRSAKACQVLVDRRGLRTEARLKALVEAAMRAI